MSTPASGAPSPGRVQEVLDLALERPPHERGAFVAGVCGGDEKLREEVESLLAALTAGGELLEPPAVEAAAGAAPLTGLSFGNYRVRERVGAGGMGVVYRAEDTRLGRAVAVKALPAAVARDAHRRARFEHEARVLASLNHPNIGAIYGVEETARGPVLVLEYVPGESLAARLKRGALAVDEAVAVAVEVARGLEAAHSAGVVHRDLKPGNIQLAGAGGAKILDFGVAKQVSGEGAGRTVEGGVVGTAAYMSPEQARGRAVDRRTDLWALGCVLYEMLTGVRTFDGETASDAVAAVLRAEPDWSRLPAETPGAVRRVLRRCLEKDPGLRQRDAGDVALELLERPAEESPRGGGGLRWIAAGVAAAGLLLGSLVGAAELWRRRAEPPAPVRFQVSLPPERALVMTPGGAMAISPDGRVLVFAGGGAGQERLFARRLDAVESVELAGTERATGPCFSPDGQWVAFCSNEQLRRVRVGGGGAEVLLGSGVSDFGLAWDERGIYFYGSRPFGLRRLNGDGEVEQLTGVEGAGEQAHLHPEPIPGTEIVCYTRTASDSGAFASRIDAVDLRTGRSWVVAFDAACPRFVAPDRLVFWQSGALRCAGFDAGSARLTGTPVTLMPLEGGEPAQPARFAVSGGGVLATIPGSIRYDLTRLAWLKEDGGWSTILEGSLAIDAPRLSPDGGRVAVLMGLASGDVYVHDLARASRTKLTSDDRNHHPVWSRDGRYIYYTSQQAGQRATLRRIVADGTAEPEVVWEAPEGVWVNPTDVTLDGRVVLAIVGFNNEGTDVYLYDPRTGGDPERLLRTRARRFGARVSPEGSMIAYTSEETGSPEVYLHRFPSMEQKLCLSSGGGYRPAWSGDGRRLFFRYAGRLMAVEVGSGEGGIVASPAATVGENLPDARYDVDMGGARFVMPRPPGEVGPQLHINIEVGWRPPAG